MIKEFNGIASKLNPTLGLTVQYQYKLPNNFRKPRISRTINYALT